MRALLDVPGATLLMLPRLLIDDAFRVPLIERHVRDPMVRAYWRNEYAGYSDSFRNEAIAPIQNKIGKALMVPSLRNMLAQPKSSITMRRLMDESAIVICNLAKGQLGESTSHLIGALIVTAFAQAALSETIALYSEVRREFLNSPWSQDDIVERVANHIAECVGEVVELPNYRPLLEALDPSFPARRGGTQRQCRRPQPV